MLFFRGYLALAVCEMISFFSRDMRRSRAQRRARKSEARTMSAERRRPGERSPEGSAVAVHLREALRLEQDAHAATRSEVLLLPDGTLK